VAFVAQEEEKPADFSSMMATITSIIEEVLEKQGDLLSRQKPDPWKVAHRQAMSREQRWRNMAWNKV